MIGDENLVIARTPLRLSLGGGGTDLPFYADRFGGDVTTAAISLWVTVIVRLGRLDGNFRYSYERTAIARSPRALGSSFVAEALELVGLDEPCEVVSLGPVPAGTGLGSSGAFAVSLLAALNFLVGRELSPIELAEQAFRLEAHRLGHPTGRQDHYACALGGLRRLVIGADGIRTTELTISAQRRRQLGRHLHLFYTGRRRDSAAQLQVPSTGAALQERIEGLHRIRELGDQIRAALEGGLLSDLPALMAEHWQIKARRADPCWEAYLSTARRAGAQAGKIVGAGGGGFLLVYVNPEALSSVVQALSADGLQHVPFRLVREGTTVSHCLPGQAQVLGPEKEDL